jgi:N-acetylneuraminic acid mutarotase/uncharacterized membrane protein YozB (DUF420 family)
MQFATLTLVVEVVFYIVLCLGVVAQLRRAYKWHDRLQAPVVVLNVFFILFVMVPTFRSLIFDSASLSPVPVLVTTLHALLGTIAQGLAIYCLLAGFKVLPRKIGTLRYWMWATFVAWTLTVVFGTGVYFIFYGSKAASDGPAAGQPAELTSEHDEGLIAVEPTAAQAETPPTAAELVEEHSEAPVAAAQPTEPPLEGDPLVDEHAETPAAAVEEEVPEVLITEPPTAPVETIDEHGAVVEPGPVAGPVSDQSPDEMAEMIAEHAEEVLIEPQFTGELGFVAWERRNPVNDGPGPRYEHAMQHNPVTNELFVFGGRDGSQIYNDVWAFQVNTLTWRRLAANSPVAPPARYSTVMIIDNAGQNLYIATGQTQGGREFNDVWRLDLQTEVWQPLVDQPATGLAPAPRYGNPGGKIDDALVLTHGFGSTRYDDTWRFDTAAGQWQNITPTGSLPLKRCLFAATATEAASLVIHGGCAAPFGDCFLDDAWELNPQTKTWREITGSRVKPVGRQYHSLVSAVSSTGSVKAILFGGQDATLSPRNDTWILDVASGQWTLVDPTGAPSARYQHAAVWIPGYGMLMFGGRDQNGALGDLWYGNL